MAGFIGAHSLVWMIEEISNAIDLLPAHKARGLKSVRKGLLEAAAPSVQVETAKQEAVHATQATTH